MLIHLLMKYEDIEKYLAGQAATAVRPEDKSMHFRYADEVVQVSVNPQEIYAKETITVSGFHNGEYPLYMIEKLD